MAVYTYSRVPAFNPNTSPVSVAKSATGSVYDIGDTGFLTALTLTLVATNTVTTSLVSDANGMFPDFTLVDRTQCVFKSGALVFVLTTTTPIPGPTGAASTVAGPAGPATTDASLLAAGTVADARLPTRLQDTTLNATYATLANATSNIKAPPYLAQGNGTTLDTTPQQNALNTAGAGTTEYPKGTYLTGVTLTRPVSGNIHGHGPLASSINWAGGGGANPMMTTVPGSLNTDLGTIEKIGMSGGNVATYCLQFKNLVGLTLSNLQLANAVNSCLNTANVNSMAVRDTLFIGGTNTAQLVLAEATGGGTNAITWDNCSFATHSTSTYGLQIQPGDVVHVVSGCNFEGNSLGPVGIICSGTTSILVENSFFENWTTACIAATSGTVSNLTVLGGNMAALSSAAGCIYIAGTPKRISIRDVYFNTLGQAGQAAVGIYLPVALTDVEILGCRQPPGGTGTIINIAGTVYPYSDLVINSDIPTAWVGAGAPAAQGGATGKPYGIAPKAGDTYDRQDTLTTVNQRRYLCTVGGATPTWVALY